jgi:hypothetical protein
LRRSTTDWTWLRPLNRVARSIVAFITQNPRCRARIRALANWLTDNL